MRIVPFAAVLFLVSSSAEAKQPVWQEAIRTGAATVSFDTENFARSGSDRTVWLKFDFRKKKETHLVKATFQCNLDWIKWQFVAIYRGTKVVQTAEVSDYDQIIPGTHADNIIGMVCAFEPRKPVADGDETRRTWVEAGDVNGVSVYYDNDSAILGGLIVSAWVKTISAANGGRIETLGRTRIFCGDTRAFVNDDLIVTGGGKPAARDFGSPGAPATVLPGTVMSALSDKLCSSERRRH